MRKRYKKIILLLILPLVFSGCWDYKDIEKRSISLSVGLDRVNGNIEYTGEITKLKPTQMQSEENRKSIDTYKFILKGYTFENAKENYDVILPFENFTGANRVVVISQKYAEEGIESYINRLTSVKQLREASLIAICKGSTDDFFSGSVENDFSIGYAVEDTIRYLSNIRSTIYKTARQVKSDIDFRSIGYLIPYLRKDKNTVEYLGLAVMKDSKMVGIIDKKESGGFLFILVDKPATTMIIPHPSNESNFLSIKSNVSKRSIKTKYDGEKVKIYIDLKLDSQLAYLYRLQNLSDDELKRVEDSISAQIKQQVISALERSKKDFRCDIFGFAKYFKAQNIQQYRKINWKEEYLKADFYVNVENKIKNTNLIDTNAKPKD